VKKVAGYIFYYSGIIHLSLIIKRLIGIKEVIVLVYHRIINEEDKFDPNIISAEKRYFRDQVRYLSNNCHVISFEEFYCYYKKRKKIPHNSVIITFDDGYKDNYTLAYPILKEFNLKATIALTTGNIGKGKLFWWDRIAYCVYNTNVREVNIEYLGKINLMNKNRAIRNIQERLKSLNEHIKNKIVDVIEEKLGITPLETKSLFLSWKEIMEMSDNNITFAAHTVTHPILTRISLREAKKEIIDSKRHIESKIHKKINIFTYPNGNEEDMSEEIDEFLKNEGFIFSLSSIYGTNNLKPGLFRLKRVSIEHNDDMLLFKLKTKGFGSFLAPLYEKLKY
jgi:peptidoglycan/xylan/chitin deacetylase (PgdA/CDA1 family)